MTVILTLTATLAAASVAPAQERSTTSSAKIVFAPFTTSNWRSDDFSGTAYRQWDVSGDSFRFTWNTKAGDQIGSIGVDYGSSYLQDAKWQGVKIADIRPDSLMSTKAKWTPANGGWFYWSIYGWTHRTYTYWGSPDAPKGYDNEFYVIFYTQETPKDILKQPGCVAKGSVEVDGVVFDCYATLRPNNSQWLAVRRGNQWNPSPSVKLKKIFEYWCSQGLDSNQYVISLTWALEGFGGSAGSLQLTNTVIPNLASSPSDDRNSTKPGK